MIFSRYFIILYVVVCVILVIATLKKNKSKFIDVSERQYFIQNYFPAILICILFTPIVYFIWRKIKKT